MSTIRWAAALIWAGLALGCVPIERPKVVEAQPTRVVSLEEASAKFKGANPLTQIGVVAAVLPNHNLVAVSDLPEHSVQRGDEVDIIDASPRFNTIARAKVDTFNDRWVMVEYFQPQGRLPQVGDFMILVPLLPSVPGRTPSASVPSTTAPVGTVEIPPAAPTPPAVTPPAVTPPAVTPPATTPAATPDTPATTPPAATPPAVTPPATAPAATPDTPAPTPPAATPPAVTPPPATAPAATPDTPATTPPAATPPATVPATAPATTETPAPKTDAGNAPKPPELNK